MVYELVLAGFNYFHSKNDLIFRICPYFMNWVEFLNFKVNQTILKDVNHKKHPKNTRNNQKIFIYDVIRIFHLTRKYHVKAK